jgi:hypothetical protein
MAAAADMVARILRNDRRAVELAKETIFEVIGRTFDEQLKVECLFGYALCGGNPAVVQRSQEFFDERSWSRRHEGDGFVTTVGVLKNLVDASSLSCRRQRKIFVLAGIINLN